MPRTTIIVVIGGTGHFGSRICRRLAGEPNTELVVTSRSEANATRFVGELVAGFPDASIRPAYLDQFSANFEDDLRRLSPTIVVHTAGPYQGQDYRVARACIEAGSHYIDLADGREFVEGFSSLNEFALEQGLLLVSGASTLPGLSSAVIDSLRDQFDEIRSIEISIAPAHQTPRGIGTISAVLSYCGKPFKVLIGGSWVRMYGWHDLRLQRYPRLGTRLAGICDVPDLGLLPEYVEGARTVTFHAALEAPWEQLALWLMGWLTRLRLVMDWSRFAHTFQRLSDRLNRLGSDTGGMHIRLTGIDNDQKWRIRTWYLMAGKNHGPEIPCSPALVLARKLAQNRLSKRGAYACLGLVSLLDFEEEVRSYDISWQIAE